MLDLADFARVRAASEGRALPIAGCRRVERSDVAIVFCPLSMAGEDTTTHTVAVGELGDPEPTFFTIPDPRNRERQQQLFLDLAEFLLPYAEEADRARVPFQLWVSSPAAIGQVFRMSDRMRFTIPEYRDARTTRLGLIFRGLHLRHPHRGQQALIVATSVLAEHYASGQEPGEDAHLGAQLAWHEGDPATIHERVRDAEQIPMGIATDPQEDRELARRLSGFHAARLGIEDGSHTKAELAAREQDVADHLEPVAARIYAATQRAAEIVLDDTLPPLPGIPELVETEAFWHGTTMEVARWMVENDRMYGRWDTFERAMKEHDRREQDDERYERMLLADPFVRRQAELDGVLVRCQIVEHKVTRVKGNSRSITMELDAPAGARVRVGDVYSHIDDAARLKVQIDRVRRERGRTRIEVTSVGTQKAAADEIHRGDELLLSIAGSDFRFVNERARKRIFGSSVDDDDPYRLPFTHDPEHRFDVTEGDGTAPADPLEALEALAK